MKKFYFLFLLTLLPLVASADAVEINGIYYNLDSETKTAEVTRNPNIYSGVVSIPESVIYESQSFSVTSIGNRAFNSCTGMTSISIPNSVITIGNYAFSHCSGLTSIVIPNSVTTIEENAFHLCIGLSSISIGNGVTTIGRWAFDDCYSLTSITIPNSVTYIGHHAFEGCSNLTSLTIPSSVTSIERSIIAGCTALASITVDSENTIYDSRDNCNAIINTATNELVAGCKNTIIPGSVTSLGLGAFENCSSLSEITIPNSVTTIYGDAFYGCKKLLSISIPSSVNLIRNYAFAHCSGLSSITVESGNTVYDSRDNCNAIIETSSNTMIAGCKTTVIPNTVKILSSAFLGCSDLESIIIPNSVTTIGFDTFAGSGLRTISIPNSVTSIEGGAFYSCSNLSIVYIPQSVTKIDDFAFGYCEHLRDVYCFAKNVPETSPKAFDYSYVDLYRTLHVPAASVESYKAAEPWNKFYEIVPGPNGRYMISYEVDGEMYMSYELFEGDAITPEPAPTKEGYTFSGWSWIPSKMPSEDVIISGSFTANKYKLVYMVDDVEYKTYEIDCGATITPEPTPTKDGYTFSSWSEIPETMPANDVTITGTFTLLTDEDEITIKEIGKTTWCSKYDLDFTNVEGIKAYIAIGYDDIDKTIWLARVMKVPAGTGLLVKGNAGTYKIPHGNVRSTYVNYLKGNLGDAIKIEETDGDKTNYYLSGKDGTFVSVNGSANIGKNKAYLQLPTSVFGGTRSIGISYDDEDGTTGIKNLTPALSEGEGEWYTLQGQRVAKPGKGLYIRNGKKVVIK